MHRTAAFLAVTLAVAACGRRSVDLATPLPPGASAAAHRARWADERAALEAKLDELEARLLTDQARVHLWAELRQRHETVSQLACSNLSQHASSIARYEGQQREKRDALAKKNRVAARFVAPSNTQ